MTYRRGVPALVRRGGDATNQIRSHVAVSLSGPPTLPTAPPSHEYRMGGPNWNRQSTSNGRAILRQRPRTRFVGKRQPHAEGSRTRELQCRTPHSRGAAAVDQKSGQSPCDSGTSALNTTRGLRLCAASVGGRRRMMGGYGPPAGHNERNSVCNSPYLVRPRETAHRPSVYRIAQAQLYCSSYDSSRDFAGEQGMTLQQKRSAPRALFVRQEHAAVQPPRLPPLMPAIVMSLSDHGLAQGAVAGMYAIAVSRSGAPISRRPAS